MVWIVVSSDSSSLKEYKYHFLASLPRLVAAIFADPAFYMRKKNLVPFLRFLPLLNLHSPIDNSYVFFKVKGRSRDALDN